MCVLLWSFEGERTAPPLTISAVIAVGVHLFPFRTEQLSPLAPMVLGAQAPGRVGSRRILRRRPPRGAFFMLGDQLANAVNSVGHFRRGAIPLQAGTLPRFDARRDAGVRPAPGR